MEMLIMNSKKTTNHLIALIFLSLCNVTPAWAKPCANPGVDWSSGSELTVSESSGGGFQIEWPDYPTCEEGGFNVAGYDVYYGSGTSGNNSSIGRVAAGATSGLIDDTESHTDASCYYVRAYSKRGPKGIYSIDLSSGNCDGGKINQRPVVNVGPDVSISLGEQLVLNGAATDDGLPVDSVGYSWSQIDGPSGGQATFTASTDASSGVGFNIPGSYTLRLTVTDSELTAYDQLVVVVTETGGGNEAPQVNAGSNTSVNIDESLRLVGEVSDDDQPNGALDVMWSQLSGPGTASFVKVDGADIATIDVKFDEVGTYILRLSATDTQLSNSDDITVTVTSPATGGLGMIVVTDDYNPTVPTCDAAMAASVEFELPLSEDNLIWSDEFNLGYQLSDLNKHWNSAYAWGPEEIINNEGQYYIDALGEHASYGWSPFELVQNSDNGYLVIKAAPSELAGFSDPALVAGQDYVSGVLTSRVSNQTVNQVGNVKYGYFEIRAKMPKGNGTWPAFWLYPNDLRGGSKPEIDVIEYLGQSQDEDGNWIKGGGPVYPKSYNTWDTQYHSYHPPKGGNSESASGWTNRDDDDIAAAAIKSIEIEDYVPVTQEWCGWEVDFSEEFHVYGMKWSSTEIVWYIDGIQVHRVVSSSSDPDYYDYVKSIVNKDMYLTLNLALGNPDPAIWTWPGPLDSHALGYFNDGGVNHINMAIDYVRVYRLNE